MTSLAHPQPAALLTIICLAIMSGWPRRRRSQRHDHGRRPRPRPRRRGRPLENHLDPELVARPDRLQRPATATRPPARPRPGPAPGSPLLTGSTRQLAELKPAGNRPASGQHTASGSKAVIQSRPLPGKPATTTRLVLPHRPWGLQPAPGCRPGRLRASLGEGLQGYAALG